MRKASTAVPDRVLAAAEGLFAEYGYQGCSLLKIAKAAGTSESGVLRFFNAKEDVFLAVIANALVRLHQQIDTAFAGLPASREPSVVVRLMTILDVVFALYAKEPEKVALIFSEGGLSIRMLKGSEGHTLMTLPGMTRLVDQVGALFAQGRREGTFPGIDPVAAREVYFGILEGVILGWLLSSAPGGQYRSASAKQVSSVVRKMLHGLTTG